MPSKMNKETRVLQTEDTEIRVSDDNVRKIEGYTAKFNKWSADLGGFREKIHKNAFDEALKESDVRALKNHDSNLLLGRTTSGTLKLFTNSVGLRFEVDMPDTNTGRDTLEEIRRGDLSGCSFAFTVTEDDWKYREDGSVERTILRVGELFDVGPVTYPAYPDTSVAARSLEAFKDHMELEAEDVTETEEDETDEPNANPENQDVVETEETEEVLRERQRLVEIAYRRAGRVINRCRRANAEAALREEEEKKS